jgi:hypothetical protein
MKKISRTGKMASPSSAPSKNHKSNILSQRKNNTYGGRTNRNHLLYISSNLGGGPMANNSKIMILKKRALHRVISCLA